MRLSDALELLPTCCLLFGSFCSNAEAQEGSTTCLPSNAGHLLTPGISYSFEPGITEAQRLVIRRGVENANEFFTERLGARLQDVAVFAFSSVDSLGSAYANAFGVTQDEASRLIAQFDPRGPGSFAIPTAAFLYVPSVFQGTPPDKTIAHELFHVLQYRTAGATCLGSLTWLVEGAAELAAWRALDYSGSIAYPLTLNQELGIAQTITQALNGSMYDSNGSVYALWFLAVEQLVDSSSQTSLMKFWTMLNTGIEESDAFSIAFGVSEAEFYRAFEAYRTSQVTSRFPKLVYVCRGLPSTYAEPLPSGLASSYYYTFYLENAPSGPLELQLPNGVSGWTRSNTDPNLISVFLPSSATSGTYSFTVNTPARQPLQGTLQHSNGPNPAPDLTGIFPITLPAGSEGQIVSASLSGLACNAQINISSLGASSNFNYIKSARSGIILTGADLAFPGQLDLSVMNPPPGGGTSRTASLQIMGPRTPVPISSADAIVNSASLSGGGVSPGELITIFGTKFAGLGMALSGQLTDGSSYSRTLGKTQLLFDGTPAPLLFVGDGQITAVVPYAVALNSITEILVRADDALSVPMYLPVRASFPGVFTATLAGIGQAAALNQDGTFNSVLNPATRGSIVVVFATGEGELSPQAQEGTLTSSVPPTPVLPVSITIGGQKTDVLYGGEAPGLVSGLLQVNVRIPVDAPGGNLACILSLGTQTSRSGVTIAVAP